MHVFPPLLLGLSERFLAAPLRPNGRCSVLNSPHGVLNVVSRLICESNGMHKYSDVTLMNDITVDYVETGMMASVVLDYF